MQQNVVINGDVAQWLVQRLHKALVDGSNPSVATINIKMQFPKSNHLDIMFL